ncbi:MAG: hypothetical protein HRU15_13825 [Planctomycetes bacterium]|nr:hypothetical protein [Planctomycetota bacterium]
MNVDRLNPNQLNPNQHCCSDACAPQWIKEYYGQLLAVDLIDGSILFGTIKSATHEAIQFMNSDLHDMRSGNSSKEVYGLETQDIGIRVNRKECSIPLDKILAVCYLSDLT